MVISITPGPRSEFNDLSKLKIKFLGGSLETPNRFVNRHDLNAKDKIGADIPLTRSSKSFIFQEILNQQIIKYILTENGYLAQMINRINPILNRIRGSSPIILLYPSITSESQVLLDNERNSLNMVRFFIELASQLRLESVMIPVRSNLKNYVTLAKRRNIQFIPVIDLKLETNVFDKIFNECLNIGKNEIPLVAFKFISYPYANKSFDIVMDKLDKLHEGGQATMLVDIPRRLQGETSRDASGPHYGAFMMADLVAERYVGGFGQKKLIQPNTSRLKNRMRVFCRNDLVTTIVTPKQTTRIFDMPAEREVFSNDEKLGSLFENLITGETSEVDLSRNRPLYVSRVHESVRSREEFQNLSNAIEHNEIAHYLHAKKDMNQVISNHLAKKMEK